MQLRVARLCLDCEELHVDDRCPICASSRYAFLARWLPSDERRRWRRAPPTLAQGVGVERYLQAFKRVVARWLGDGPDEQTVRHLRTRASDSVPSLEFRRLAKGTRKPHAPVVKQPLKHDG